MFSLLDGLTHTGRNCSSIRLNKLQISIAFSRDDIFCNRRPNSTPAHASFDTSLLTSLQIKLSRTA